MITVNTYMVAEGAVYAGVSLAISKMMNDSASLTKPEEIIDGIVQDVMSELCDVMEFSPQSIRFTPDLMRKMWNLARMEADAEEKKKDESATEPK